MFNRTETDQPSFNFKIEALLTFDKVDSDGEKQRTVDVNIPLTKYDSDVRQLLDKEFFPYLAQTIEASDERSVEWLSHISTCAQWSNEYAKITGNDDLTALGNGKWHFAESPQFQLPTDCWSAELKRTFGFGTACSLLWMEDDDPMKAYFDYLINNNRRLAG